MDIIKNPTTIKLLAQQLIKACDLYLSLRMNEKELKDLINYYGMHHGKKLFNGKSLNPTIVNRIGKKRTELVSKMLEGFQISIL